MDKNLRQYMAEMVGTFALVYVAAGTVCSSYLKIPATLDVVGIALAQGLILAVMLTATMQVSGGFLNPAVTLTLWVFKRLEGSKAIGLAGAQLLGAVLAGLCVRQTFSPNVLNAAHLGTPHLNVLVFSPQPDWQLTTGAILTGIGVELILTFILTFAIFGAVLDPRAPRLGGLGPGLALAAGTLMAFGITGAAANPARWFGPVVWEMTLSTTRAPLGDHLVYWIGPIAGALLAGVVYSVFILPGRNPRPSRSRHRRRGPWHGRRNKGLLPLAA
jgi:MIP family channel proteins